MSEGLFERERQFHDRWAAVIDLDGLRVQDYFEARTAPENRFILRHLGDVRGKRLLDLGCGAGENSVYFARRGAQCVAADLSPGMVEVACQLAARHDVSLAGQATNALALDFPDQSFDIVYAANLLHHLPDPKAALREMHRVLVPGGKACFWDPLRHNPVINIYRRMATAVRTDDETPLDINLVPFIQSLFAETHYSTFWLATLWIFLHFYLVEGVHPNDERYWKKIIREHERLTPMYARLEQVDRWLKHLPGMRRLAWNLAVVAVK